MDKYAVISNELRSGIWGVSGKLPSCRTLARHYGCSVTVVQQALKVIDREGLIRSSQGRGVFWASSELQPNYRASRIIGVSYLNVFFNRALEVWKPEWLRRGWFLSGYNADLHFQEPEAEREFVLSARRENFAGLVLLATPLQPDNAELYRKMRWEGMKIAHLIPYRDDMTEEPLFAADYRAAGRLAAAEALRGGFRRVVFWREGDSPDRRLNRAGLEEGAREFGLTLLADCDPAHTWDQNEVEEYLSGRSDREPAFLAELLALPPGTCICAQPPVLIRQLLALLRRHGRDVPGAFDGIALDGTDVEAPEPVNTVVFDRRQQLGDALEYIADRSMEALTVVRKLYAPRMVFHGKNQT